MGVRRYIASFIRYFICGGIAMLIHFGTLILLVEEFKIMPIVSTSVGFCIAVIFNYLAQFYWTFKPTGSHKRFIMRFVGVTIITLNINTGLFWFLTEYQNLPYLISQVFATGVVFLLNFVINHHFTFKSLPVSQNEPG